MIIYKIQNRQTGQVYIGQTIKDLAKRIYQHCRANSKIGKAIKKYGIDSFDISVIDYADTKQELDELEKFWISWYRSNIDGYNVLSGGTPTNSEMKILAVMKKTRKHKHRKCYYKKMNSTPQKPVILQNQAPEIMNKWEAKKNKVYNYIKTYSPKTYKEIEEKTGVKSKTLKKVIGCLISIGKIDRVWTAKQTFGKYFVALR